MDLTVDLELNEVIRQIDRYIRELGMDGPTVVKTQTRLLLKQIMDDATPPDDLAQGRDRIAGDLRKVFVAIDPSKWRVIEDDAGKLRIVPVRFRTTASGKQRRVKSAIELRYLSYDGMKNFHYARMNSRGRVPGRVPASIVGRRNGDVAKLGLVKMSDFRKYRASVQKRVGKAKAGWRPGAAAVGGSAGPSWVARQSNPEGSVNDVALSPGELDPRITVINAARGVPGIRRDVLATSLRYRAAAMKTHIKKLLDLAARQNGLG